MGLQTQVPRNIVDPVPEDGLAPRKTDLHNHDLKEKETRPPT